VLRAIAVVLTSAALVAAPVSAVAEDGPELIPGGGFEGTTQPWFVTQDMSAANTDGQLCVDVPGGTTTAWSSIIGVDGVPIVKGQDYDFSFTAAAVSPTPVVIRALVQQPVSPWDATFEANPSLGGDETEFSYTFNASLDLPAAQVVFQVGGADEPWSLCIDDVSIHTGDPAEAFVPETGTRVRVNQVGYLLTGPKHATLMTDAADALDWTLRNEAGDSVATGQTEPRGDDSSAGGGVHVIDFSEVREVGDGFTIDADGQASHPFAIGDDLYDRLRYDSLQYFHLVRSGIEIDVPGYEREAGHLNVAPNQGDTAVGCQSPQPFMQNWTCDYELDVRGGWYDAGDHGKYVVNGGIAVYQLMSAYERTLTASSTTAGAFDDGTLDIPESSNGVPDLLDEARWELEWMLRMQVPAGEELAGMVHHKVQDDSWTGLPLLPADDPKARQLHRPSTAATLNLAAVAAQGSRLFAPFDAEFADDLLAASRTAWDAANTTPRLFAPAADGVNGGGPYDDDDVADEFYCAAAELYLTTGEPAFESAVLDHPLHTADIYRIAGFDWGHVAALARMDLATVPSELPDRDEVVASVIELADKYADAQQTQNFGQPYAPISGYGWGSNSSILNNMVVLATAYDLGGDARFSTAVVEGMDYILGRNAMNNSYVTGYGTTYSHNQHSRWFAHQLDADLPSPPPGTLAGGPNRSIQDPLAQQTFTTGCADQLCYLDDIQSWSTNEMTVNWNSSLVWVASFVADQTELEAVASVKPAPNDQLPLVLVGGGLVLVALIVVMVLRGRGKKSD